MPLSKKLISVIVPTYNQEAFIGSALESVLGQEMPGGYKLEVIVADDSSTDGTAKVVRSFGDAVRYKKIAHSGTPARTRNEALRLAKGELIAFLDGDDKWVKDKLVTQLNAFDDPSVVLSFGNAKIIDTDGNLTGGLVVKDTELKDGEKFQSLLNQNVISTLTVMVRRQALQKVGNFNESEKLFGAEDYELWLRLLAKFPSGAKSLAKPLGEYRVHARNISAGTDLEAIERLLNIYSSLWETPLSTPQRAQLESVIQKMHKNWGRMNGEMYPKAKPAVSVIMSVYNGGDHLKQSIKSILDQTFKDFEFIIIDDGSTDNSVAVINGFGDKRIRLVRQTNHGLVYSLNFGIELARGDYIARQDADDISLPKRLAKEVVLMDSNKRLGLVGTFFTYINEDNHAPGLTICMPTKSLDVKRAMYVTNPIGHGTAMIRRAVFQDTKPYTDRYGPVEDFELCRRIAENWDIVIIPESLYGYLLNSKSISHTQGEIQHANTTKIIDEQWAKPFLFKQAQAIVADGRYYKNLDSPFASLVFDQYASQQIDITKTLLQRGNLKTGLLTAYGALRLKPQAFSLFIKPALRGTMKRMRLMS